MPKAIFYLLQGDYNPKPLYPKPYTLYPKPITLYPKPHTLNPTPQTPSPILYLLKGDYKV